MFSSPPPSPWSPPRRRCRASQFDNWQVEDWSQTWDPFEDGANWRQLRRKRAAVRAIKVAREVFIMARRVQLAATIAHGAEILVEARARRRAIAACETRERHGMAAEEKNQVARDANVRGEEALRRLGTLVTLRTGTRHAWPCKRALVWREYIWEVESLPANRAFAKAAPGSQAGGGTLVRAWNMLARRTRLIRSPPVAFDAPSFRERLSITIRQDPATGYVLIHAHDDRGTDKDGGPVLMTPEEVEMIVEQDALPELR